MLGPDALFKDVWGWRARSGRPRILGALAMFLGGRSPLGAQEPGEGAGGPHCTKAKYGTIHRGARIRYTRA
jgi:hypothetical protein